MKIVFVGNCQAAAWREIYKVFVCPYTGDETNFVGICDPLTHDGRTSIESADVVIEQVFDIPQQVDLADLRIRGRRHRVPVVGMPFLWPIAGSMHPHHIQLYGVYQPFRSEMGDSHLNRLLEAGVDPDEAVEGYLTADMAKLAKLDRRFELEMDRQRARDLATGYRCADLIESRLRDEQLFLTAYHPRVTVSRYMMTCLLQDMGAPSRCIDLVRWYQTDSFFFKFGLPVHPGVARHFELKWASETTKYQFHSEGSITFEQFVRRYVRCEANLELENAIIAVARDTPDAAARIEAVAASVPSSPFVLIALAQTKMRSGLHEEAAKILEQAIAIDPEVDWAHQLLSQALHHRNDHAGSEAALRQAVTLRPFRSGVQAHLAHVLASRGAFEEAVAAMRAALNFNPENSHYLAKLAAWQAQVPQHVLPIK
jgi:tetratricopeptide (TPR) repeat protein